MSQLYTAEAEIRDIKLQILSELQALAFHVYQCQKTTAESNIKMAFFYKALSLIRSDREKPFLLEILAEAADLK